MADAKLIRVEVAYARPDEQVIIALDVPEGTTLEQAIALSRLQERFPDIGPTPAKVGIFGKVSALNTELKAGERVEIYRPLLADPKAVRKQRAAEGKKMKKGAGALGDGD